MVTRCSSLIWKKNLISRWNPGLNVHIHCMLLKNEVFFLNISQLGGFSYQISRLSIYSQCDLLRKDYHVDTGIHWKIQLSSVYDEKILVTITNKKHIDAMQWTYLTRSIISNRQILFVHKDNAFCKFHTFFGVVYHELKQKIKKDVLMPRSMHLHRNLPESEKYIWIIQNLKKSRFFYI